MYDVSLGLTPRTVTGLIGPNGAGKSTLARALARQQPLTSCECTLEGKPYNTFSAREFSRRVAYLPQTIPSTNGLTVEELISMGRYPWHGALGKFTDTDRAAVKEALSITNTDSLAGRLTDALSGGERQRCWIAMLLAQKADILLLDEPVSALDIRYQIETMSLVRDISRARERFHPRHPARHQPRRALLRPRCDDEDWQHRLARPRAGLGRQGRAGTDLRNTYGRHFND